MSPRRGSAQPPVIAQSDLSRSWYLVTRYTTNDSGAIISERKVDITEQVLAIQTGVIDVLLDRLIGEAGWEEFVAWLEDQLHSWPEAPQA